VKYDNIQSAEYAIAAQNGYVFPGTSRGLLVKFADEQDKSHRKDKVMRHQPRQNQRYGPYGNANTNPNNSYQYNMNPQQQQYQQQQQQQPYYPPQPYFPQQQVEANLFIYHLPGNADDTLLYRLFSPFGAILSVKVVRDTATGQCKGYGFVKMANYAAAYAAIQALNGTKVENKYLQVSFKT